MELGQKFKQIRKQRKYTIQRLAQVAGSVASISDFEIVSLGLQRLWDVSKNDQVKLRATFRGRGVGVWCLSARVLRRLPLGPFGAFRSGPSAPSARAARGGSLSRMVPQQCRT